MPNPRSANMLPEKSSKSPWMTSKEEGGRLGGMVVANLSSGQTAEEKIPVSLARSFDAQIICAFQEWTAIGAEAEVAEREEEKRFQEDVNNDILSHHHRSVANQSSYKTVPQIHRFENHLAIWHHCGAILGCNTMMLGVVLNSMLKS